MTRTAVPFRKLAGIWKPQVMTVVAKNNVLTAETAPFSSTQPSPIIVGIDGGGGIGDNTKVKKYRGKKRLVCQNSGKWTFRNFENLF